MANKTILKPGQILWKGKYPRYKFCVKCGKEHYGTLKVCGKCFSQPIDNDDYYKK